MGHGLVLILHHLKKCFLGQPGDGSLTNLCEMGEMGVPGQEGPQGWQCRAERCHRGAGRFFLLLDSMNLRSY